MFHRQMDQNFDDNGLPRMPFGHLLSALTVIGIAAGFVIVVIAFIIIQWMIAP